MSANPQRLCDFIRAERERLIRAWEDEVRHLPGVSDLSEPALRDHVPELLMVLADRVEGMHADGTSWLPPQLSETHALQRLQEGFDLGTVTTEFSILRRVVLAQWGERGGPNVDVNDVLRLDAVIDEAIAVAVSRYAEAWEAALALVDTLLAASPAGIAFLDKDLQYLRVNATLARLSGKSPEEHLGRTVRDVIPEFADRIEPRLRRILETGVPITNEELTIPDPSGSGGRRTLLTNYYPVRTETGELLGIGGVVLDITELKQAEQELLRSAEILELGDAFFTLDSEYRVTRVNRNQERISRKPKTETLGRVFWDVWPEAATPASNYWRCYRKAMTERVSVHFEEHYAPLDLWTDVTVYPTHEGGLAVFFRDATERKRSEQELLRAVDFKDRFLGIVGHDLRNPLSAIKMSAAMLAKYVPDSPRLRSMVDRIASATDRMSRMIDDLLDFTRGRLGGGIPVQRRAADLGDIARDVVEELQAANPARSLELHIEGDARGECDPDRVAQAFGNLVANALVHGDKTSPVKVTVRGQDGDVRVEVWNAGQPIPAELQERMFDPFTQRRTGAAQPAEGLGLGLYIVSEIVSAHGGHVQVRSDAEGTVFTTVWPRTSPQKQSPAP